MNLRNVDLNLLVILDALLSEQNVSRAGERVGLSQSATSAALARLRDVFHDPLLTPVGRKLMLTRKAESLVDPVRNALVSIEGVLSGHSAFNPHDDAKTFSIVASDYAVLVLLAPFVQALSTEAPNVTIHLLPRSSDAVGMLRAGRADIVIEPSALFRDNAYPCQPLFTDRWLCAVDRNSRAARLGRIDEQEFLALPHLIYSIGADKQLNLADLQLAKAGIECRVEVTVESFLLAPFLIQDTDLVSLVLERAMKRLAGVACIETLEPPFMLPELQETMYWHPRNTADPAHRWLRERLVAVAGSLN